MLYFPSTLSPSSMSRPIKSSNPNTFCLKWKGSGLNHALKKETKGCNLLMADFTFKCYVFWEILEANIFSMAHVNKNIEKKC